MDMPQKLILRNVSLADERLVNVTWKQSKSPGRANAACTVSIEDVSLRSKQVSSATDDAGPFQSPSARCRPSSIEQSAEGESLEEIDGAGSLLLPNGLAHPHIHLDKCYLLDRCSIGDG